MTNSMYQSANRPVADGTGNTGDLATEWCAQVTRVDPEPRAAVVNGNTGAAPFTATFNGSITGAHSPIISRLWDFGDGTVVATADDQPTWTHRYTEDGTYTASVTVTTAEAGRSDTATHTITIN